MIWSVFGISSPGNWPRYQAQPRVQGAPGQHLLIQFSFRQSCKEQVAGLYNCYGSLPALDIVWFCDYFIVLYNSEVYRYNVKTVTAFK